MKYAKPIILAQNESQGSFAAGCPENTQGSCRSCDRGG